MDTNRKAALTALGYGAALLVGGWAIGAALAWLAG